MPNPQYDPTRRVEPSPRAPEPTPPRRPVEILGPRQTFWVVSPGVTQTYTHYTGTRRLGCPLVHGYPPCVWCKAGLGRDIHWWLTVTRTEGPNGVPELVALTRVAVESCPDLFRFDGFLWGRRLTLWRHPAQKTGTMYAEMDNSVSPKDLCRAEPTYHTLIRMWQARTRTETLARVRDCNAATPPPPFDAGGA